MLRKKNVYAVIIAGGKGKRFWPKSRAKTPKHTLRLMGRRSLIQETVDRVKSLVPHEQIYIITNREQLNSIKGDLPFITNIIAEPIAKNTAAACGLAAMLIRKRDPSGIMVVLPSDHLIRKKELFIGALTSGIEVAGESNALVAIGVKPTFPATGYGYLRIETGGQFKIKGPGLKAKVFRIKEFVEKPNLQTAVRFLKKRRYYWNSGIFIWRASSILGAIKEHLPRLYLGLQLIEPSIGHFGFYNKLKNIYPKLEEISIDYGVLEKEKRIFVVEGKFYWDDLGSWDSLACHLKTDAARNVIVGPYKGVDTKNCVIVSEEGVVGTVGVSDLIIVRDGDCILVCNRNKAQDVKILVDLLKKEGGFERYL